MVEVTHMGEVVLGPLWREGRGVVLVRVLGSIEVRASGEEFWVRPAPQQRVVLALLVAQLGSPCSVDRLMDALWGDGVPRNAPRLVQGLVARLRRMLELPDGAGQRLVTVAEGWRLDLDLELVDASRFEALVGEGRRLAAKAQRGAARVVLEEALGLWRCRPFGELADHDVLTGVTTRLEEQRLAAQQMVLELRLADGEYGELVEQLRALVAEYPLQERFWWLLMLALHGAGRSADALSAYQQVCDRLDEELGARPGPELQCLHGAILQQEPVAHLLPSAGSGPAPQPAQPRVAPARRPVPLVWACRRNLPLVGRRQPWAVLQRALAAARGGRQQLVLVAGEPGVGKTRLVSEFAEQATRTGVEVLTGSCGMPGVPYQPFLEALGADVAATPDRELPDRLGRYAGELVRLLPDLAERIEQRPTTVPTAPQLEQHRLFDAVVGWLAAASAQAPLLVVVDDLHAATRPTLLMLRHLVNTTSQVRLLLVATYRDTTPDRSPELADTLAALAFRPHVTHLQLTGLDLPAIADLLTCQHANLTNPADWAEAVHKATAGNPLFVEEFLTILATDRPASPDQLPDHLTAPHSLLQLLDTRVRQLSPTTVQLLQQAAVAGEIFDFAEVSQAAELAENEALDALDEAAAARLVTGTDTPDEHRFTHAIMRTALLDSTTTSRQARLHARLATTLETRHADNPLRIASRLAQHYTAAGPAADPTKTRIYTIAAGDAALDQLAYDDATHHYQHALNLLDPTDDEQRCELLIRLGQAQDHSGQPNHRATLLQATRLAINLNDPHRIARAAVANSRGFFARIGAIDDDRVTLLRKALDVVTDQHPGPRALLLALLANELIIHSDLTHRRQLTDDALRLARQQDDPLVLAQVLALRGSSIQHPTTLNKRLNETAELIDLAHRLDDPAVAVFAHTWRFVATLEAADRYQANAAADQACQLADEYGHPIVRTFAYSIDSARELAWGDLDRAHRIVERFYRLGRDAALDGLESPYIAQQFLLHRERGRLIDLLPLLDHALESYGTVPCWQAIASLAWWLTGRHDRALAVLDQHAIDDFTSISHDQLWTITLCMFAEVAALAARHRAAQALLTLLAPYRDRLAVEATFPLGVVAHYLGLLATTLEDWDRAGAYLDQAADLYQRIDAPRWHNHTRLAQARLLLARQHLGDHAEANQILHETTTQARHQGQTGLLHDAQQLLRD